MAANRKRLKLLNKLEELKNILDGDNDLDERDAIKTLEDYNSINNNLNQIDAYKDESIVRKILIGLGFRREDHSKPTSFFSGGWRMRLSLAYALYMQPRLLLLDEPTNHLDLNAVIWLTNYLSKDWKKSLIIVSHDRNFLDEVCTDIVHLENKQLTYYKGNYSKYLEGYELHLKTRANEWRKIEMKIKEMRKNSMSKDKIDKFISANHSKKPIKPYRVKLSFGQIPIINNVLIEFTNLNFAFSDQIMYQNIDFRIHNNDRITIVGQNGIGKSTFLKLLTGDLIPTTGFVNRDRRVIIGYYHQHSSDILPLSSTPVEYLRTINPNLSDHDTRCHLGQVGLEGSLHFNQISTLSGGQKSRLVFASLFIMTPHLLLLDEPTNHLDMMTINALIDSINNYNGAVVLVTHNIHLIKSISCVVYEVKNRCLVKTDFDDYQNNIYAQSC
jgi:ATP-binding cassette subfamily F protein 1